MPKRRSQPADQPTSQRGQRARLSWPVRLVAVIPVAGALVLSFSNLADLARSARFDGWLAYLWPGTLDATGVVASLIWLDVTMPADARKAAMRLALAAIVLSVAGNSLRHWLLDVGERPHVAIQMAIAAVPPGVLFAMLHVLHLAQRRPAQPAIDPQPASVTSHLASPAPSNPIPGHEVADHAGQLEPGDQPHLALPAGHQPADPATSQPTDEPGQPGGHPATVWAPLIGQARQILTDQPAIGRAALAAQLDIPTSQARRLLDHLRQPASKEAAPRATPTP